MGWSDRVFLFLSNMNWALLRFKISLRFRYGNLRAGEVHGCKAREG